MVNSSATRQTEIRRSFITTLPTARIFSSVIEVVGLALRGASSKTRVESLNSSTRFATVQYDEAE